MALSAAFTVNGESNPGAHSVAYGSTVNLAMLSVTGADVIAWSVVSASHADVSFPTIATAGSPLGSTASFTFPSDPADGAGRAVLIKLRVVNAASGDIAEQYAVVGVIGNSGIVPISAGEDFARHSTLGWAPDLNAALGGAGGGSIGLIIAISKGNVQP